MWFWSPLSYGKTGATKTTCFATFLQNELNSNVKNSLLKNSLAVKRTELSSTFYDHKATII